MKAIFIYKDGELFGSPIGYTTVKGAQKALVGTEDWYKIIQKYEYKVTEETIKLGIHKYWEGSKEGTSCYLFQREVWSKKIWNPYVAEHYQFLEKEYEIVIKD